MLLQPTDCKKPTTAASDQSTPRPFQIDLYQIPLDSPFPTAPTRQAFPSPLNCASCSIPGGKGEVLVCDGCERTFHVLCAGLEVEFGARGFGAGRWPLGFMNRKGSGSNQKRRKRGFDMNASPPSDGDSEGGNVVVLGLRSVSVRMNLVTSFRRKNNLIATRLCTYMLIFLYPTSRTRNIILML